MCRLGVTIDANILLECRRQHVASNTMASAAGDYLPSLKDSIIIVSSLE